MTKLQNTNELSVVEDDAGKVEMQRLSEQLNYRSPMSIVSFGKDAADKTAEYTDQLLDHARCSDLEEVGTELNTIVAMTQEFNASRIDNRFSRIPVVGGLVRKFSLKRKTLMSKFDTVKGQVDKLVDGVNETALTLEQRSAQFDALYQGVANEFASLELHIQVVDETVQRIEAEIPNVDAQSMEGAEEHAILTSARQSLLKRKDDLIVLRHSAQQTLPMVRVMQGNNIALIDKFQTVQKLTLPAWKRTLLMSLTLGEQKQAVELTNAIDDATNMFMRRNADLLHENTVSVAESSDRLVIDVETLEYVHDKMLNTVADVRAVQQKGAERRKEMIVQLEALTLEMRSTETGKIENV